MLQARIIFDVISCGHVTNVIRKLKLKSRLIGFVVSEILLLNI